MITREDLIRVLPSARGLFDRLQALYGRLPETLCTCGTPGMCCTLLPEMTFLEAAHWIIRLQAMPDPELAPILQKFVEFYLTNPALLSSCPFLDEGACRAYPYRTFACRAYGLWSQEMGRVRTEESRMGKRALLESWRRYGLELPVRSVEFEIEYCDQVKTRTAPTLSDASVMALLREVYELGLTLGGLQTRFEEDYHSDFSLLLASLALGMRKAVLVKFAVIKEIVQKGTKERLQEVLIKVSPEILRASL